MADMKARTKMNAIIVLQGVKEIEIVLTVVDQVTLLETAENQDVIEMIDVAVLHQGLDQKDEEDPTLEAEVEGEGQGHIVEVEEIVEVEIEEITGEDLIVGAEVEIEIEEIIGEDLIVGGEVEIEMKEDNVRTVAENQRAEVDHTLEIKRAVEVQAKVDHQVNVSNNQEVQKGVTREIKKRVEVEVNRIIKGPLHEVIIEELVTKITEKKKENIVQDKDRHLNNIRRIDSLHQISHNNLHKKAMEIMMGQEILKTF